MSVKCLLNFRRDNDEKTLKILVSLVKYYLKLSALVRCSIKPIQTNSNNPYWNDNEQVLKILLFLTLHNHQK